jgi:hypothetical protein
MLKGLREAQLKYTKNGRLAGLVVGVDRGPMLAWLLVAPHRNVVILRSLLEDLMRGGERDPEGSVGASGGEGRNSSQDFLGRMITRLMPDPTRHAPILRLNPAQG